MDTSGETPAIETNQFISSGNILTNATEVMVRIGGFEYMPALYVITPDPVTVPVIIPTGYQDNAGVHQICSRHGRELAQSGTIVYAVYMSISGTFRFHYRGAPIELDGCAISGLTADGRSYLTILSQQYDGDLVRHEILSGQTEHQIPMTSLHVFFDSYREAMSVEESVRYN